MSAPDPAAPAVAGLSIDALYPWKGTSPADLELACTQIARRLIAAGKKSIGFLPAPGSGDLLPLLVRVGGALYPFAQRQAAVIPAWQRWDAPPPGAGRLGDDEHGPSLRPLGGEAGPTLLVPPLCPDASTAALSLQLALRRMDKLFPHALVDLSGLSGAAPEDRQATLRLVDGVTVVGTRKRTTVHQLRLASQQIPNDKDLGAVLIG
ncbi:MAG TPA: hypothetical protein VH374_10585 [Polyangia bacterium]|jgi:hypothetical protein|nr:hypothetical protein [Polyangia bacterium]